MRKLLINLALLFCISIPIISQTIIENDDPYKFITLLKNNTYEIKEITKDSLLIYKGKLSSVDPEIRHGKFYFFNNKGKVVVTGLYNQDIPYGTWVYYDKNNDTLKSVDYTAVWNYLESDALDYKIDTTVIESLKSWDKETMNPDGTFYIVNKMPEFNGGEPRFTFNEYLHENLIYPVYAARKSITGDVIVQFMIDDEGFVRNPALVQSIYPDLNIEAIRVLSESPKWEPGKQGKYPVNVMFTWPMEFYPGNTNYILPSCYLYKESDSTLTEFEELPLYNGEEAVVGFRNFIMQNLNYPEIPAENGISGRVVVEFTIMPDGTVDNIKVIQSADPALDAEAVRVVKASRGWTPGRQDGESVPVTMSFPFNFVLQ